MVFVHRRSRFGAWACVFALALLLLGCPLAASEDFDGGVDAGEDDGIVIAAPVPPTRAALPNLTPCPAGWLERAPSVSDGPVTCEPWAAGAVQTCSAEEALFVGEQTCHRIGSICPANDFADGLPSQNVRYVRGGGSSAGTGTPASPFSSISAALASAPSGTVIAIAKGTYDEEVRVPAGVTLWGACPAQTVIARSVSSAVLGSVIPLGPGVVVKNLSIGGARSAVVSGLKTSAVELRDVIIRDAAFAGVVAAGGGQASLFNVAIRRVVPTAQGAYGVYVENGGKVALDRVAIEHITGTGISCFGNESLVEGTRVSVLDGHALPNGKLGGAVEVTSSGKVTLSQFFVDNGVDSAVYTASGGAAALNDGLILNTGARPADGGGGHAVTAQRGGLVEATRVAMRKNRSMTVVALDVGARVLLTDCSIEQTLPELVSASGGFGVVADKAASIEATRVAVFEAQATAIAIDRSSTLVAADLTVLDTIGSGSTRLGGFGVVVTRAATATVRRARVERNRAAGVAAGGAVSALDVEDLIVKNTFEDTRDGQGTGANVQDAATLRVRRALIDDSRGLGVSVTAASLEAEDVVIRGTTMAVDLNLIPRGVHVQESGMASMVRVRFELNQGASVSVLGAGSTVSLAHVSVLDSLALQCQPTCPNEGGTGLVALREGALTVSDFRVHRSAACGVQLAGGSATLNRGAIWNNTIGVCAGDTALDLSRFATDVTFNGNATKLSADFFPLPDIALPTKTLTTGQ